MERFAAFIMKHKKWVFLLTVILIVLAVVGTLLVVSLGKINSDMLVYLPEQMDTAKGQKFLAENFHIEGDAMLVVQAGEADGVGSLMKQAVDEVKNLKINRKIDGKTVEVKAVSQLVWVGEISAYNGIPGVGELIDATELTNYLKQLAPESEWSDKNTPAYNYILLGMLNASASSPEAFDTLQAMRNIFTEKGLKVASEGMTHTADIVMNDTLKEIPFYLIFGLVAVLLILLLTTESFLDPLILLTTLGVSILIAMGTNILFPSISIISFAVSAILQLAVTMDYAIVFMHIYKQKLRQNPDPVEAVKKALPNAWSSILASCLTTVGGFVALFFMRFELGADLGMVLVKAVLMSMVSVVILQPVLTVSLNKWIQKTRHKSLKLTFEKPSRGIMKVGRVFLIITLVLLLPSFIFQNLTDYSYFKMYDEPANPTSYQSMAAELRNQLIVAVPYDLKTEKVAEGKTQADFIAEIKTEPRVKNVVSIFSVIKPEKLTPDLIKLIKTTDIGKSFFAEVGEQKQMYTLYTIVFTGDVEDKASLAAFANVEGMVKNYFGEQFYTMGMLTGVNDMASVTPTDFTLVSLASAVIIFLVLLLILRNFKQSVMLVLIIEIAIFLNLAVSVLMGTNLNFMVYILISSVQLGCTVDYAILLATRYKDAYIETCGDRYEAARLALKNSASAILISASIIISVCLGVLFISGNLIIKQMMELVARGGAISLLLVITSLPTFLSCTKPTLSKKEKLEMQQNAQNSAIPVAETEKCAEVLAASIQNGEEEK